MDYLTISNLHAWALSNEREKSHISAVGCMPELYLRPWTEQNKQCLVVHTATHSKACPDKSHKDSSQAYSLGRKGSEPPGGSFTIFILHCIGMLPTCYLSFIIIIHFHCYCPPWKRLTPWDHQMSERERAREQYQCRGSVCMCVAHTNIMAVRRGPPETNQTSLSLASPKPTEA